MPTRPRRSFRPTIYNSLEQATLHSPQHRPVTVCNVQSGISAVRTAGGNGVNWHLFVCFLFLFFCLTIRCLLALLIAAVDVRFDHSEMVSVCVCVCVSHLLYP